MRPFYAAAMSHCLASYVMLAATFVLIDQLGPSRVRLDGQDVPLLIFSPLYTWYMLLESLERAAVHPRHAVIAWASYVLVFCFLRRRAAKRPPERGN